MPKELIIDLDDDAGSIRERRRRIWYGFGVPIASIILIAGAILGGAIYQHERNREDVLALSSELIDSLQARVESEVTGFLQPAADGAKLLAAVMPLEDWSGAGRKILEDIGMKLMRRHRQIGPVSVGRANGDFLMVRRSPDGGIDTKTILHENGKREVTWVRRNPEGEVTAVETDPDDTYDPRLRPWYRGARQEGDIFWSEVYVFFTDQSPGVTVAVPIEGPEDASGTGEVEAVVGIDMHLSALNPFLEELRASARGHTVIVDANGQLVAAPGKVPLVRDQEGELQAANVHQIDDPLLSEAFERTRLSRNSRHIAIIDGTRHIVASSSLAELTGRDWHLLVVAPVSAFAGFVSANSRRSLMISGATVLLAIAMAATLAWQAVKGERSRRRVAKREASGARQMGAMETLVETAATSDVENPASLAALTRTLALASSVQRVGIWRREHDELVCLNLFDADAGGHTEGTALGRHECPGFFASAEEEEEIAVSDAAADQRTRDLADSYLTPSGMKAFLSVAIGSDRTGFLWLEAPEAEELATADRLQLARLTAGLLSLMWRSVEAPQREEREPRIEGAESGDTAEIVMLPTGSEGTRPAPQRALRTSSLGIERRRAFGQALESDDTATDRIAATVFPHATVAVIRLFDDIALAHAGSEAPAAIIERIVGVMDSCADELNLPYLKVLGSQIVAADGFDEDEADAATLRIAEFALRVREPCADAFLTVQRKPSFSIGIDTGPLIGSAVGFGEGVYNVWGESLEVAACLAAGARPGTIHVSAASYEPLRKRYLMRPRGAYFLERVGEMRTFDLSGRL